MHSALKSEKNEILDTGTRELVFVSPFYLVLFLHKERKIFFLILTLSFVIGLFTHSLGMQPLRIETFYDMLLWYLYKVQLCTAIFLICVNKSYERKLTFKKRHKKSLNSRNLSFFLADSVLENIFP